MDANGVNAVLSELHDMIQDAKGVLLQADKCIINRDDALSLIEETIDQLPSEIKSARTIVDARNELIFQGKKEAESTLANAKNQANEIVAKARKEAEIILSETRKTAEEMIAKESVYIEAQKRGKEMIEQTQKKIDELRSASNAYICDSLKKSELAIEQALKDLRQTHEKFSSMTGADEKKDVKKKDPREDRNAAFFQDIS